MPRAKDIKNMLEEIKQDEKSSLTSNSKLSQVEIARRILEKRKPATKKANGKKEQLGEILLQSGTISNDQLEEALTLQSKRGGKIGSLLVELGYLSSDSLVRALSNQFGLESTSLFESSGLDKAMCILPLSVIVKFRVLPLDVGKQSIKLAMEGPVDIAAIHDVEFVTGKRVDPVIVPAYEMDLVFKSIEENGGRVILSQNAQQTIKWDGSFTLRSILEEFVTSKASDLMISAGVPPTLKICNELQRTNMEPTSPDTCILLAKTLMRESQWEEFLVKKELDFAMDQEGLGRFRVNAYMQRSTISISLRYIPDKVPNLQELGLPPLLEEYAMKKQGLIVFAAPTGHGKTTALHSMVDHINTRRKCNIICLEDPIEYLHHPKLSNINQREVGTDTHTFSEGLRRVFRQAPDVIVIGEMRDSESLEVAIRAASSGHLVLATIHALNTTTAIDSMINYVPQQLQGRVRQQLSEALLMVFSQRLIPRRGGKSLCVAYEKLINSHRIKNFMRENKEHQIRAQIQQDAEDFSSMDVSLIRLVKEGKIDVQTALPFADSVEQLTKLGGPTNPSTAAR